MNDESVTRTVIRTKRTITQSFIIVTAQVEQFGGKVREKAEMGEDGAVRQEEDHRGGSQCSEGGDAGIGWEGRGRSPERITCALWHGVLHYHFIGAFILCAFIVKGSHCDIWEYAEKVYRNQTWWRAYAHFNTVISFLTHTRFHTLARD